METTKTKRGRPETQIQWPEGEFTAEQVFKMNSDKVSRVSVHNKINRNVRDGVLAKTKKASNKIGRPSWLYSFMSAASKDQSRSDEIDF